MGAFAKCRAVSAWQIHAWLFYVDCIFWSSILVCWVLSSRSLGGVSMKIIGGSAWTPVVFRESRCWTFALSDRLWRVACQNVKIMWLLVCLVWLLEWLHWNNVTHLFNVLLFSTETSGVVFMVTGYGQKTNSGLVFPPLTRTLWIDGLTKNGMATRKKLTFSKAYWHGWLKPHHIGTRSQEKLTKPKLIS